MASRVYVARSASLDLSLIHIYVISKGVAMNMVFLIATGLPFNILVGCDLLRRNSAIIDLSKEKVSLFSEGVTWTADLVGSEMILPSRIHQQLREINYIENKSSCNQIIYDNTEDDLWAQKIQEIRNFRCGNTKEKLSVQQTNNLIRIYEKYRTVFSDEPGKIKNYQCKIQFREPVEFNRKSYPIAHSLKEAVRAEINKMISSDIIESSQSPFTSPIVAIPKKNGQVWLCLDAREINKMIINDRISPGEIEEILKSFHGTKFISIWDTCLLYTSRCV